MDELGLFHFPLRRIRAGALFPNRHEPNWNQEGMPVLLPAPQYIRGTTRAKNIGLYRLTF